MSTKLTFRPIPEAGWGFQPLEPLSECLDHKGNRLGVLFKTYTNDPELTPGKPIWVYAIDDKGGWAATSEFSEEDLQSQVLKLHHPKKGTRK